MKFVDRLNNRLLKLLILDWRFTCLLFLLLVLVACGVILPAKIWRRTPSGFVPEIRISALDFFQARALNRSARQAEESGDIDLAIHSLGLALANDPGNKKIAAGYIQSLLRSTRQKDTARALQIAGWLRTLSPTPKADELYVTAADRNEAWDLVLEISRGADLPPEVRLSVVKALFRTKNYREAKKYLKAWREDRVSSPRDLYLEALDCILTANAEVISTCPKLRERLHSSPPSVEAHEIYLITCAEKRNLAEFTETLALLKRLKDQSLAFDLLHARWLYELGRQPEARAVMASLAPPRSALDTFRIAEGQVAMGEKDDALSHLRRYSSDFSDSAKPWILYARLLLDQGNKGELRSVAGRVQSQRSAPALNTLWAAITAHLQPTRGRLDELRVSLQSLSRARSQTDLWYFASDALLAAGQPEIACETLLTIEPDHLQSAEFYGKLFAAAEACRDAKLMRRVAERRYQLVPGDLLAVANHAAMLIIFEDRPEEALALSAFCEKAQPGSIAAKINHAAALINAGLLGPADLILNQLKEEEMPRSMRNQFRYIKLKRAIKIRDMQEASRLAPLIDKSGLYSSQIGWLEENRI